MLRVYKTFVLPVMPYASVIWSPHLCGKVEDLEAVQRRFSKKIVGNKSLTYGQRLDNLQLLSLESARMECDLLTAFKLIRGKKWGYLLRMSVFVCAKVLPEAVAFVYDKSVHPVSYFKHCLNIWFRRYGILYLGTFYKVKL